MYITPFKRFHLNSSFYPSKLKESGTKKQQAIWIPVSNYKTLISICSNSITKIYLIYFMYCLKDIIFVSAYNTVYLIQTCTYLKNDSQRIRVLFYHTVFRTTFNIKAFLLYNVILLYRHLFCLFFFQKFHLSGLSSQK